MKKQLFVLQHILVTFVTYLVSLATDCLDFRFGYGIVEQDGSCVRACVEYVQDGDIGHFSEQAGFAYSQLYISGKHIISHTVID